MKRISIAALLFAIAITCQAQTTQTQYFKKMHGVDEVDEKAARFSRTITRYDDGAEIITWKDLKRNEETTTGHRGDEPVGVWVSYQNGKKQIIDYDFTLTYAKRDCADANQPAAITNYLLDDPAQQYVAPKIASGEANIAAFLQKNVRYPAHARRSGIQGSVFLHMTISKSGKIEDIVVKEGVDPCLDKESVRVIRKLQLSTPPMLQGQPIDACVVFPIRYKLAN